MIPLGFLASLAAGLATGLGAIPVLFIERAPEKLLDTMLGFAAGVMLAATAFSLANEQLLIVRLVTFRVVWIRK